MPNEKDNFIEELIDAMSKQFGDAVKGVWVYAEDLCPACHVNDISEFYVKGQRAVSINAFMYRVKGVMIAYLLCGDCAEQIHASTPYKKTSLHANIETTLIQAYERYLASMDA